MMAKQLEALKPGKYAILYRDNWDGEGDTYHTIANLEADGRWSDNETGKELLGYQGDEILKAWPLDDSQETLALIAALEQSQQRVDDEICRANREHHRGFMMACKHLEEHANVHYADAAEVEIAALRNRIAELEASPLAVKLPDLVNFDDLDANSQDREVVEAIAQCKGWNAAIEAARRMNAAGGQVEGE